ncbi:MAG: hypothetical protein DCF13_11570 [Flavobacteriaceae bacterium]|nr:MAG: hypothetical protein DCF13_11570 [Flavobacteriaceae bacterium]
MQKNQTMANINHNRINVVLSEADTQSMLQDIASFISKIPECGGLTPEERKKLKSINVANKIFSENVLNAAKTLPNVLPSYIDLSSLENDLKVFTQLDQLETVLLQGLSRLQDAKRIAGHEAYMTSNVTYEFIKNASRVGIPGTKTAHETLKARYTSKNQGKNSNDDI